MAISISPTLRVIYEI